MRPVLALVLFAFSLPLFADITVSTITPAAGVITGGTIVHLHGTNLLGAPLTLSPPSTGMFLDIPRRVFDAVTITTHVHDTTHDAESLGVDIPSIPETQFRPGVVLSGIPNDPRYRLLLRVYGYAGAGGYPL